MVRLGFLGLAVGIAAGSCSGGDLPPNSGQLVLAGRDVGHLFFWKPRTLAFTRDDPDSSNPDARDLLVWPLDEPAPAPALAGVDWTEPSAWGRRVYGDLLLTGVQYEVVYDVGSGQAANLLLDSRSVPDAGAPEGGETVPSSGSWLDAIAIRPDKKAVARVRWDGRDTIIVGRPPDMRVFPLPDGATVRGMITFLGADLVVSLRQATANGDTVGIFRLDTASGALTTLVTPTSAEYWSDARGICGAGGAAPTDCDFLGTVGCALDEPPCPDGNPPPCLIYYTRVDPDGVFKVAGYVYDVNTATTTRLAGDNPEQFFVDRDAHHLVWGGWNYTRYRNLCSGVERECRGSVGEMAVWRPDGNAFATFSLGGLFIVVDVAAATCELVDTNKTYGAYFAQYAPGSDRLLWMAASDIDATSYTLWLADGDARSPVAIASAPVLRASFSPDGRALYVTHYDSSNVALGWVDLAASPPVEQILSTNGGGFGLRGDRRALFIDHYNSQDENGELVLVELATGARRSLARAVTDVAVADEMDADGMDVAYAVRGRAGTARDGLWLTTLPPMTP